MPTRVENILKTARITLADISAQRWDDETLLAILNEGQMDFCQHTQVLHDRVEVPIFVGLPDFDLPSDCWLLTRVLYDDRVLPLVTHRELDEMSPNSRRRNDFNFTYYGGQWEDTTGSPEAIVYDRQDLSKGRIFPIPEEADTTLSYNFESEASSTYITLGPFGVTTEANNATLTTTYGVVTAVGSLTGDSLADIYGVASSQTINLGAQEAGYGVVVALDDYTFDSPFGVLVDLSDPGVKTETFEQPYGVISNIEESCLTLRCYFLKIPGVVDSLDSELDIPEMYDLALKFYVVAHAFLNDLDAASQAKAAQQLAIYERHVRNAAKDSSRDFTQAGQFQTTYRRGV